MSAPEGNPVDDEWNLSEDDWFQMERRKEQEAVEESYIPDDFYLMEDADGERLVKKEMQSMLTPETEQEWTDAILLGAGLRRYLPPTFPRIVCLCGSTRFYEAFQRANYDETMAGNIVLTVGFYPHSPKHGEGVGHDSAEKIALDALHKRKIDLCDEVFVLNVGSYVGDSTRSEIQHALRMGKPVRYLEPETRS